MPNDPLEKRYRRCSLFGMRLLCVWSGARDGQARDGTGLPDPIEKWPAQRGAVRVSAALSAAHYELVKTDR